MPPMVSGWSSSFGLRSASASQLLVRLVLEHAQWPKQTESRLEALTTTGMESQACSRLRVHVISPILGQRAGRGLALAGDFIKIQVQRSQEQSLTSVGTTVRQGVHGRYMRCTRTPPFVPLKVSM